MVTEKNSQINQFVGGIDTDTAYQAVKDTQCTMVKNMRVSGRNGTGEDSFQNSFGEIRPIEGIDKNKTDITFYTPGQDATLFDLNNYWGVTSKYNNIDSILATGQIRQYGIIVFEYDADQTSRGNWAVSIFKNKIGEDEDYKTQNSSAIPDKLYVVFDSKKQVKDDVKKFSIVTRYENDESIKVYIADTENPLVLINIANPALMYQLDIDNVKAYPDVDYNVPEIHGIIFGNLKPGLIQYSYQLYSKYGVQTNASPLSKKFPVVNGVPYELADRYKEQYINGYFTGYADDAISGGEVSSRGQRFEITSTVIGASKEKSTTSGVLFSVKLENLPPNFDSIIIYRIQYLENGQVPIIKKIVDSEINKLAQKYEVSISNGIIYTFSDRYEDSFLEEISVEEFNSLQGIHIIPKQIESKFDYMFASNIEYEEIPDVNTNLPGMRIKQYIPDDKRIMLDYYTRCKSYSEKFKLDMETTPASGPYTYDGIWSCILKSKNWFGDGIETLSYYDPKTFSEYRSLRGMQEIYKYGIIFYYKNFVTPVFKLGEIITDTDNQGYNEYKVCFDFLPQKENDQKYVRLISKPRGVEINISHSTFEALYDRYNAYPVAFEIVRRSKDFLHLKNISQGVITLPFKRYSRVADGQSLNYFEKDPFTSTGLITMTQLRSGKSEYIDHDLSSINPSIGPIQDKQEKWCNNEKGVWTSREGYEVFNYINKDLVQFISPEVSYQGEYLKETLKDLQLTLAPVIALHYQQSDSVGSKERGNVIGNVPSGYPDFDNSSSIKDLNIKRKMYHQNFSLRRSWQSGISHAKDDVSFDVSSIYGKGHLNNTSNFYSTSFVDPINKAIYSTSGDNRGVDYQNVRKNNYSYFKLYLKDGIYTGDNAWVNLKNQGVNYRNPVKVKKRPIIADVMQWNELISSSSSSENNNKKTIANYQNFIQSVGDYLFVNAVVGSAYDNNSILESQKNLFGQGTDDWRIGIGGSCMLLQTQSLAHMIFPYSSSERIQNQDLTRFYTILCNLQNDNARSYVNEPYGTYYSFGNFFKISSFEIENGTTIHVFDGDVITTPFEYVSEHKFYSDYSDALDPTTCIAYSIPVETSIALPYTHGFEMSRKGTIDTISNIQEQASNINGLLHQDAPMYQYNTAYSQEPIVRIFAEQDVDKETKKFDYRVCNSQQKLNGELIDSFTKYQSANYIDVDTRYGELTNLRAFVNSLIFWQEHATGILSVNERQIVQNENGMDLILGTGGVLDRYDYIDRTSGMHKYEYCDAQSADSLFWFDDDNQEIKQYGDGQGMKIISKQKNVQNLMDRHSDPNVTPNIFYDPKYNEAIFNVISFNNSPMSVVYNEQVGAFAGVYDIQFDGNISFYNGNYITRIKDRKIQIAQWNSCKDGIPKNWDNVLNTYLEFVVNNSPVITKVFDNQEIVTANGLKPTDYVGQSSDGEASPFKNNNYKITWRTDLNNSETSDNFKMTNREGNFRYAIERENHSAVGGRIRGKYMVVGIENTDPVLTDSMSYIITKYRVSWS